MHSMACVTSKQKTFPSNRLQYC